MVRYRSETGSTSRINFNVGKQIVSPVEAAEILGVQVRTIGRLVAAGRLQRAPTPKGAPRPNRGRPPQYVDLSTYVSMRALYAERFSGLRPRKKYEIQEIMSICGISKQAVCYAAGAGYLSRVGTNEYVVVLQE